MRCFFTVGLWLIIFTTPAFAQNNDSLKLIDEIGQTSSEDLTARMEVFGFQLMKNPTAKGFIVIYRDKSLPIGFPIRLSARLQNYLTQIYKLPAERFEIMNGGLSETKNVQLWLSFDGSRPPLNNNLTENSELKELIRFDSFEYPSEFDYMSCCAIDGFGEEEKYASLDEFAQALKKQPAAKGHIIFYGQYCTDCTSTARYSKSGKYLGQRPLIYLDSSKTVTAILAKEKNYLNQYQNIAKSRIMTVNGGYRKWKAMELWIIPKDGQIPKPTPESFPKRTRKVKISR